MPANNGFGSSEIVFLRPRFVVPGILGPTMDEVYLMISVSGGKRTPNNEDGSLQSKIRKIEHFVIYATECI